MKISILQQASSLHLPSRSGDPSPTSRNLDPLMHPFSRARERTRALNAAKISRIFAKPFIDSLGGHIDAIEVLAKKPGSLNVIASGSWDGGIILHDLAQRSKLLSMPAAHRGKVSGLCFSREGILLSCGVDCNVKLWNIGSLVSSNNGVETGQSPSPVILSGKSAFNSIDHHISEPLFATASTVVQVWDESRSASIMNLTFPISTETITGVRFNPSESSILASTGSDRGLNLYDVRTGKAERRLVMRMRSNALSWSPTHPAIVLLASEDHNLYTFDIRHLATPRQVYKAHVAAVMSCDWSPTGLEFVSGGWDRTVRIWRESSGSRPEVYHTKRMQRVTSTLFTSDANFIVTGSDDGRMRLWKARASCRLGVINARERAAMEYRGKLVERWEVDDGVSTVLRMRHVPKPVYRAGKLKKTMLEAKRAKEERRRKHSREGETKLKAEKKKVVFIEQR